MTTINCRQLVGLALAGVLTAASAQNATSWEPIEKSMAALLSEGYQIQSTSAMQTMREWCPPIAGVSCGAVPDAFEYTFTLARQGKWVICVISNPQAGRAHSRCRALN